MELLLFGIVLWYAGRCLTEFGVGVRRMLDSLKFTEYEDPCEYEENGDGNE